MFCMDNITIFGKNEKVFHWSEASVPIWTPALQTRTANVQTRDEDLWVSQKNLCSRQAFQTQNYGVKCGQKVEIYKMKHYMIKYGRY